jgi:hypothetical protein
LRERRLYRLEAGEKRGTRAGAHGMFFRRTCQSRDKGWMVDEFSRRGGPEHELDRYFQISVSARIARAMKAGRLPVLYCFP